MELIEAVKLGSSARDTLRLLGRKPYTTTYAWLRKQVSLLALDTSHWTSLAKGKSSVTINCLCIASDRSTKDIKRYVLNHKLITYTCAICGCPPVWNDKPMVLRLDHISGDSSDHRLQNLRFVCPNCDSQLPTFAGRNVKNKRPCKLCITCGVKISRRSEHCSKCKVRGVAPTKIKWPPDDELINLARSTTMIALAKHLGVSNTAIRSRLKKKGLWPLSKVPSSIG